MNLRGRLRGWQFIFWIHGHWEWGWIGNGWNCLRLGKVRIYFASGPHPFPRLKRWFG